MVMRSQLEKPHQGMTYLQVVLVVDLYGKFTEVVKYLLLEATESKRQQFDTDYETLTHESTKVFTYILQRISSEEN